MILKCIRSFKFAFRGLYILVKNENNAKVHLIASILVVGLGFFFKITSIEWLWIFLSISLIWMAEAFNSAVEKLVDLVSPNFHPIAGAVKDMAAGAVLCVAIFSAICGAIIFIPKILFLLQN